MLARDGLLALFLGDFVSLGGDERDELDAALDEQVACVFVEGDALAGRQDLRDDFLDRGFGEREVVVGWCVLVFWPGVMGVRRGEGGVRASEVRLWRLGIRYWGRMRD